MSHLCHYSCFPVVVTTIVMMMMLIAAPTTTHAASSYDTKFLGIFRIPTTTPNVSLSADGYIPIPKQNNSTEKFPLLIFPNSWGIPQIEYILKAHNFAEEGFVAVEYETRGWWLSDGEIETAGPIDRMDASTVLTYCLNHATEWNIDTNNVAFVGISYGAGISLMAAGNDTRVKTAVAMSGWGNLLNGFYYNRSPNKHEAKSLLDTAKARGHPSASLEAFRDHLLANTHINETLAFAAERSPEDLFLNDYNTRQTPIFLSNNMYDRIFYPQAKINFWNKIKSPKFMLVNQGKHAEPEAVGLTNLENYIWGKVSKWLHYWLKNDTTNGIMEEPNLQIQHGMSMFSQTYKPFSSVYPDPQHTKPLRFTFTSRGNTSNANGVQFGGLQPQHQQRSRRASTAAALDNIQFTQDPPLVETAGKQDTAWSLGFPPTMAIGSASPKTSAVYLTEPFANTTTICGSARLNLTVAASQETWQLYAFIMVVPGSGAPSILTEGQLVGDTCYTYWGPGVQQNNGNVKLSNLVKASSSKTNQQHQLLDVEFRTNCRDVPAGSRVGVGIVLNNALYSQANSDPDLTVGVQFGDGSNNVLELPAYV